MAVRFLNKYDYLCSMKPIIRKATTTDIHNIQHIAGITFPLTYKDIITPAQTDYMMKMMYSTESLTKQMTEDGHTYLIASIGDEDAGYVSVQPLEDDVFELQKIYVLPKYQGKHLGGLLFDSAVKLIKQMHPAPCRVELHVNRYNKAQAFYEHKGMKILRQGDYDIGNGYFMNDYIMGMDI